MVKNKESDWKNVYDDLTRYFWEWYYKPLIDLFDEKITLKNAKYTGLIQAIKAGRVVYRSGVFTGKFNSRISRELSQFAKYDKRKKIWKGQAPGNVVSAAVVAESEAKRLNEEMKRLLSQLDQKVVDTIQTIKFNILPAIESVEKQTLKDLQPIGITPELTPGMIEKIQENYTTNMQLNIVSETGDGNWNAEQIENLRKMIQKNVTSGYSKIEMIENIMAQWDVSRKKARFLARQETSLFISEMTNARYQSAGLQWYEWKNSRDIRVVGNPGGLYPVGNKSHGNHWLMGGKICSLSDPTIYADSIEDAKKGRWKSKSSIGADDRHAGESFNCRCAKKPILV